MLKKTLASVGLAGALVLGGIATTSAAFAYPAGEGATVSDSTIAPGGIASISVPERTFDGGSSVTFSTSGPGVVGSTLSSLVHAAATGSTSVTKTATDRGVASAKFTAPAGVTGSYPITISGVRDGKPVSLTVALSVTAASAGGSTGAATGGSTGAAAKGALPATGGDVPVAALWLGVGAIGIGGVAVAAGVARRRAHAAN